MEILLADSSLFQYLILPLLIFFARIVDVSLDTLRIIFLSRGNKVFAPILGFFSVIVWLIAITRIMANLDNFMAYIGYAAGFAVGNYIGLKIEEKLAIGIQIIRVITSRDSIPLIQELRSDGFAPTVVDAHGKEGPVHVIFLVVRRQVISEVIRIISRNNPKAFYSIEDVRSMSVDYNRLSSGSRGNIFSRIKNRK